MSTLDDITTTISDIEIAALADALPSLSELGEAAAPAIGSAVGATAATASRLRRTPRTRLLVGVGVAAIGVAGVLVVRKRRGRDVDTDDQLRVAA